MPLEPAKLRNAAKVVVKLQGPSAESATSIITWVTTYNPSDPPAKLQSQCQRTSDIMAAYWLPTSSSWIYRGVEMTGYGATGNVVNFAAVNANQPGSVAAALLPPGDCIMLTKVITNPPGFRSTPKGRIYLPSVGDGSVDNAGLVTPGSITAFETAWNNVLANLNIVSGGGITTEPSPMLLAYGRVSVSDPASPGGFLLTSPVTSFKCDPKARFLRSRQIR